MGTYEVSVPAGHILAAEFDRQSVRYWIVNPGSGSTSANRINVAPPPTRLPGTGRGKVVFNLDKAAGVYLTNKQANASPRYQVVFSGEAESDAMAGWLLRGSSNERGVFDRLRTADDGSQAAQLHRTRFVPLSLKIQNDVRTELNAFESRLKDLLRNDMIAAQQRTIEGLKFFYPTSSANARNLIAANTFLQQVDAGSNAMLPWVSQISDLSKRFRARATADANALAQINPASIYDAPAVAKAALGCARFEGFVRETAAVLEALPENADTDNDKADLFTIERRAVRNPVSREQALIEGITERAAGVEARFKTCLESAIGEEPGAPQIPDSLADYEALALEAEKLGNDREQAVRNFVDYLDTFSENWEGRFAEAEGGTVNGQPARYAPARWLGAADRITRLAESFAGVGQPGAASAVPTGFQAFAKTVSSPNACDNPTWTFDFNVGGLNVVIGTPFDDRVQGNDSAASYEAIFGLWGDDCLNGRDGFELIAGNWGDDEIHGGDKMELLTGGAGDDTIFAGHGMDVDWTLFGADVRLYLGSLVSGSAGSDELFGNDPADTPTVSNPLAEGYTNLFFGDGLSGANPSLAGNDIINTQGGISVGFGQMGDDTLRAPQGGRIDMLDSLGAVDTGAPILFGSIFAGQSGNDTLEGSPYLDALFGGRGNDTMRGRGFIDFMMGQRGADTMRGDGGIDLILAGNGDDTLEGNAGEDLLIGWAGNDTISGGGGLIDGLFGGRGDDNLNGNAGMDFGHGGRGEDEVAGGPDINLLLGAADNDTLTGGGSYDILLGQGGSDWLRGGSQIDFLIGNAGYDRIDGQDGTDVLLGMNGNDVLNGGGQIDLIFGNDGNDIGHGGPQTDLLMGLAGSDCLFGGGDFDIVMGNQGSDYLEGNDGTDLLLGMVGNDELRGGPGFDLLFGLAGNDNLFGDGGTDLIVGSAGRDFINGGDNTDIVLAGAGDDDIDGDGGADIAMSGDGADALVGTEMFLTGAGNDHVVGSNGAALFAGFGGSNEDILEARGATVAGVFGGSGADSIFSRTGTLFMLAFGNSGNDLMRVTGSNGGAKLLLFGNQEEDSIESALGNSFLVGNDDNDRLSGYVSGDAKRDYLFGNRKDDVLYGNRNKRDRLYGGWGKDKKERDTALNLGGPPAQRALQPNNLAAGDRWCRNIDLSQLPRPGAARTPGD